MQWILRFQQCLFYLLSTVEEDTISIWFLLLAVSVGEVVLKMGKKVHLFSLPFIVFKKIYMLQICSLLNFNTISFIHKKKNRCLLYYEA